MTTIIGIGLIVAGIVISCYQAEQIHDYMDNENRYDELSVFDC